MVLPMPRPQLHPRTKVFWLRRRVPADLVASVGQKEVTLSLGTKDPAEAKRRFSEELAKLEARWAALRQGSRSLTEIEAHGLAREVHDWWLQKHQANPSEQGFWRTDLADKLWAPLPAADAETLLADCLHGSIDVHGQSVREMKAWCVQTAERLSLDASSLPERAASATPA